MPRSTMELPRFFTCPWETLATFINLASVCAPSSPARLVAVPICAIVSVKPMICSVWIPSWPPAAASSFSSAVVCGMGLRPSIPTVDKSIIPCLIASSCSGVPSTVFSTPAKLSSKSMANLAAATPPAAVSNAILWKGFVAVSTALPTSCQFFPVS